MLMSLKFCFFGMPAAIPCFVCPLGLTCDILKGLFFRNARSHSLFFMPLRSQLSCPQGLIVLGMPAAIPCFLCPLGLTCDVLKGYFFKECPQPFLVFYAL